MVQGKVIQVAGPAVDVEFPEGQIPLIQTAVRELPQEQLKIFLLATMAGLRRYQPLAGGPGN